MCFRWQFVTIFLNLVSFKNNQLFFNYTMSLFFCFLAISSSDYAKWKLGKCISSDHIIPIFVPAEFEIKTRSLNVCTCSFICLKKKDCRGENLSLGYYMKYCLSVQFFKLQKLKINLVRNFMLETKSSADDLELHFYEVL